MPTTNIRDNVGAVRIIKKLLRDSLIPKQLSSIRVFEIQQELTNNGFNFTAREINNYLASLSFLNKAPIGQSELPVPTQQYATDCYILRGDSVSTKHSEYFNNFVNS